MEWRGGVDDRIDGNGEDTGVAPSFLFEVFGVRRLSAGRT